MKNLPAIEGRIKWLLGRVTEFPYKDLAAEPMREIAEDAELLTRAVRQLRELEDARRMLYAAVQYQLDHDRIPRDALERVSRATAMDQDVLYLTRKLKVNGE